MLFLFFGLEVYDLKKINIEYPNIFADSTFVEYIDIIKNILADNTDFKVKDNNISCSIDGKCEIKR